MHIFVFLIIQNKTILISKCCLYLTFLLLRHENSKRYKAAAAIFNAIFCICYLVVNNNIENNLSKCQLKGNLIYFA